MQAALGGGRAAAAALRAGPTDIRTGLSAARCRSPPRTPVQARAERAGVHLERHVALEADRLRDRLELPAHRRGGGRSGHFSALQSQDQGGHGGEERQARVAIRGDAEDVREEGPENAMPCSARAPAG